MVRSILHQRSDEPKGSKSITSKNGGVVLPQMLHKSPLQSDRYTAQGKDRIDNYIAERFLSLKLSGGHRHRLDYRFPSTTSGYFL